jgi:hypothetical protein
LRRAFTHPLLALAGYAALTVLYTLPLSAHPGTHMPDYAALGVWVPFAAADAYLVYWIVAWDAHAIATRPLHVFDANILYPAPSSLAGAENLLGYAPLAAPVYWTTKNPVLAAHAAMLASYVLGAFGMFLLLRRWTHVVPAFVAGLAFAFAPFRTPNVNMLAVLGTHAWPFLVLATERYLESGRVLPLAGVVAALLVSAYTSLYWGYAAFFTLGTHALVRFRLVHRHPRRAVGLAGAAAAAVVLFLPVMIPYLRLRRLGVLRTFGGANVIPLDLLPQLFVGGGLPPLALAVIALAAVARLRVRRVDIARPGAWSLAVAVLALGCLLTLGSYLVLVTAPSIKVPLPYLLLTYVVPGFASTRSPLRFFSLASFALAIMVGLALEEARRRAGGRGAIVAAVLGLVLTADLAWHRHPIPLKPVPVGSNVPAVYRYLREHGDDRPLLELPSSVLLGAYQSARAMYFSTFHWLPILNGHTGHPPPTFEFLMRRARKLPAPGALQEIVNLVDLGWILVHRTELGAADAHAWEAPMPGLELVGRFDGGDLLYRVVLSPAPDLRTRFRRWYEATETLTGTRLDVLPETDRRGHITSPASALTARAGILLPVPVEVRNASDTTWPAYGVETRHLVRVHARWIRGTPAGAHSPAPEFALPADVKPGETAAVTIEMDTSALAEGEAVLEVTLAQDGMDFPAETTPALRLPVQISRPPAKSPKQ